MSNGRTSKMISAYGSELDIEKLKALALVDCTSSSKWLIMNMRRRYHELFGNEDPKKVLQGLTNSP